MEGRCALWVAERALEVLDVLHRGLHEGGHGCEWGVRVCGLLVVAAILCLRQGDFEGAVGGFVVCGAACFLMAIRHGNDSSSGHLAISSILHPARWLRIVGRTCERHLSQGCHLRVPSERRGR
jgi:hypothetical protein